MSSSQYKIYLQAKKDFNNCDWGQQDPLDACYFASNYTYLSDYELFSKIYALFYDFFYKWDRGFLEEKNEEEETEKWIQCILNK